MMPRSALALVALLAASAPAVASEPAPRPQAVSSHPGNTVPLDAAKDLANRTLNAVAYLPQAAPKLGIEGNPGLRTVMFQAFLQPGGTARVRSWDSAANRYSAVTSESWRGDGDTLCLGVPAFGAGEPVCFQLHVWGPAFSGSGVNQQGMIKGDLKDGDVLR